ncbi:MAG TPA: electron transporter RnfG [Clostridiales bacterium]|nr:electron transporter RnfG [Clostridiales bacterium]
MKKIIKPTISLFVICLLTTTFLAVTSALTEKKILERAEQDINATRKIVLSTADTFEEVKDNAVVGKDENGNIVGHVITVTIKGYGGNMQVMVGIDSDEKVSGVSILSHSETPGLGAKAADDGFLSQFKGINSEAEVGVEIDSISGATISSAAVTDAVNKALNEYITEVKSE